LNRRLNLASRLDLAFLQLPQRPVFDVSAGMPKMRDIAGDNHGLIVQGVSRDEHVGVLIVAALDGAMPTRARNPEEAQLEGL